MQKPLTMAKRAQYDTVSENFLYQALLASQKSHDFAFKEGAALATVDNRLIGIGYNGVARPFDPDVLKKTGYADTYFHISAPENAIYNALAKDLRESSVHVTYLPCPTCLNALIQCGVSKITYASDVHVKREYEWANVTKEMLTHLVDTIAITKYTGRKILTLDEEISSWDEKHMFAAAIAAERSKDPNTQVGAIVVDSQNREMGTGYNGFARNISDDDFPWSSESKNIHEQKYPYIIHAERNALLNAAVSTMRLLNEGTAYLTHFPKPEAVQGLIQVGIKRIVYLNQNPTLTPDEQIASQKMLEYLSAEGLMGSKKTTIDTSRVIRIPD